MYLSHFRLREKPFQISPDPKFLWLGEVHREALATMNDGVRKNRGLLLLSGDVGTGKTTLINRLLENLEEDVIVAAIPDPGLEKLDFYNFLTHAFSINKTFDSKGDFLVYFIHFLHQAHADNKRVLIIIDEAQRLSHEMLEEIRQLSNIEKKETKLLNIFLVGQNELLDILSENRNRALQQRIATRFNIDPIRSTEVEAYIRFRLKTAGTEKKLFTGGAVKQVVRTSECYPRLINIICDHALLTAYVKGRNRVTAALVRESTQDLQIKKTAEKSRRYAGKEGVAAQASVQKRPLVLYFGLTVALGVLFLVLWGLFYTDIFNPSQKGRRSEAANESPRVMTFTFQADMPQPPPNLPEGDDASAGRVGRSSPAPAAESKTPAAPPAGTIFTIRFPTNSNAFTDESYAVLNSLVEIVQQHPELRLVVSGHTDSSGDYNYNKRLSTFRANVVKSYFVGQGVAPARIETIGMGPEKPLQSNATAEGRRANRRVEIELKKNPG